MPAWEMCSSLSLPWKKNIWFLLSNSYRIWILLNLTVNISCWLNHWQDSRNSTDAVKEIQTHLGSLVWRRTTVPQCEKGFPLSLCNPLIHGVEQYMKNHLPTTSKELNYHAELKAACNWSWSGERLYLDMEESLDGRRKIAAKEILKTWKKMEAEVLLNEIYSPELCFSSCGD